jgi:hypothetical protein
MITMRIRHSLINELQKKIEKTYALDTGITNIEQYITGDKGYEVFYAKEEIKTVVNSSSGARVLIRDAGKFGMMYTEYIDRLPQEDRLRDLRQFSRMTCPFKIRHIQSARN